MPRTHRNSRLLLRIFFVLVIVAGLFGWRFGVSNWQPDLSTFELTSLTGDTDWIELVAGVLEDAIQVFQDITSRSESRSTLGAP